MTTHKYDLKAVRKKRREKFAIRRKRSAAIKAVAEANGALDAHLAAPNCLGQAEAKHIPAIIAAAARVEEELELNLAIELNNLIYFDEELADEYSSLGILKRNDPG